MTLTHPAESQAFRSGGVPSRDDRALAPRPSSRPGPDLKARCNSRQIELEPNACLGELFGVPPPRGQRGPGICRFAEIEGSGPASPCLRSTRPL